MVVRLICRSRGREDNGEGYTDSVGRGDTKTYVSLPVRSGSATLGFLERQEITVSFYTQDKVNEHNEWVELLSHPISERALK